MALCLWQNCNTIVEDASILKHLNIHVSHAILQSKSPDIQVDCKWRNCIAHKSNKYALLSHVVSHLSTKGRERNRRNVFTYDGMINKHVHIFRCETIDFDMAVRILFNKDPEF